MLILRDLTDEIHDFESLVRNTDDQDYIDDCRKELLKSIGSCISDDRGVRRGFIEYAQLHAKDLEIRFVRGRVSLRIRDAFNEDGEVMFRRVYVPIVN